MLGENFKNPLRGARIGSTLKKRGHEIGFLPSAISGDITKLESNTETYKKMSGSSNYAYTDAMNQGTLSFSFGGKFLKSNIGLSAGGYLGFAKSQSHKVINIQYSAIRYLGLQHIDFDDLTISEFIESLKTTPNTAIVDSLINYIALKEELSSLEITLLEAFQNPDRYPSTLPLINEWQKSCIRFQDVAGEEFIAGIFWGSIGGIDLEIKEKSTNSSWKYGGQFDFSYASFGTGVAVKATYDGSNSSQDANVEANATEYLLGDALSKPINDWFKILAGKAYDAIANIKPMDKIPNLSEGVRPPKIPDFKKPNPKPAVKDAIDSIDTLEGLEAYSIVNAYKKAQEGNPSLTFQDFLRDYKKTANHNAIDKGEDQINNNSTNVEEHADINSQMEPGGKDEDDLKNYSKEENSLNTEDNGLGTDYIPIGAWLLKWTDVFPWIATGSCNDVTTDSPNGKAILNSLKVRTMLQDLNSLSRLYYFAKDQKFILSQSTPLSIANDFAAAYAKLSSELTSNIAPEVAIQNTLSTLGPPAKKIYNVWNNTPIFRNCGLGLGVVTTGSDPSETWTNVIWDIGTNGQPAIFYPASDTDFNRFARNYSAFAAYPKLYPIIDTDGKIYAFISLDTSQAVKENNLVLSTYTIIGEFKRVTYSKKPKTLTQSKAITKLSDGLELEIIRMDNNTLVFFSEFNIINDKLYLVFIPIPISASEGIPWKGSSFHTGLSMFSGLKDRFAMLKRELQNLDSWSLSSSNWPENSWHKDHSLSFTRLSDKFQYVGLVNEPNTARKKT